MSMDESLSQVLEFIHSVMCAQVSNGFLLSKLTRAGDTLAGNHTFQICLRLDDRCFQKIVFFSLVKEAM